MTVTWFIQGRSGFVCMLLRLCPMTPCGSLRDYEQCARSDWKCVSWFGHLTNPESSAECTQTQLSEHHATAGNRLAQKVTSSSSPSLFWADVLRRRFCCEVLFYCHCTVQLHIKWNLSEGSIKHFEFSVYCHCFNFLTCMKLFSLLLLLFFHF